MICFACEEEYSDELEKCPYCGFEPEKDEEPYCPYSIDGACTLTDKMCESKNYLECLENKIENGDIKDEEPEDFEPAGRNFSGIIGNVYDDSWNDGSGTYQFGWKGNAF